MKKLLLSLTLLALMAGSAAAVDIGSKRPGGADPRDTNQGGGRMGGAVQGSPGVAAPEGEDPVRPVPEPGTMALASMGLIALGAAARKRRR